MRKALKASEAVSVHDAALLWFGKDPDETLHGYGAYGWIVLLTRDSEVHALMKTILSEIEHNRIECAGKRHLAGLPSTWNARLDAPGDLDPRATKLTAGNLAKFAAAQNERPIFLAHLLTDPVTHSGAVGRPSMMNLILREMERREARGDLESMLNTEARALAAWAKSSYPALATPTPKAIANALRERYRALVAERNPK
jgi:hypothetical protein